MRSASAVSLSATNNRATDTPDDPAEWNLASYSDHPVDSLEPLPEHAAPYRDAALNHLRILWAIDGNPAILAACKRYEAGNACFRWTRRGISRYWRVYRPAKRDYVQARLRGS
jgi:hypothetical protein